MPRTKTGDIRQYLLHELNSFLLADDIEKLVCKCDGNFLYARMISDSLKKGHFTLENVLSGENGDLVLFIGIILTGPFLESTNMKRCTTLSSQH